MATQPIDRQRFKHQQKTLKAAPQLVKRSNKLLIHEVAKPHTSYTALIDNPRMWRRWW